MFQADTELLVSFRIRSLVSESINDVSMLYFYISYLKYAHNMFIHFFISFLTWMMQVPVNSDRARITFLFLVEATNAQMKHGLEGLR
jgi:hypothetical protein